MGILLCFIIQTFVHRFKYILMNNEFTTLVIHTPMKTTVLDTLKHDSVKLVWFIKQNFALS